MQHSDRLGQPRTDGVSTTTRPPSKQEQNLAQLLRFMGPDQKATIERISELTGLTYGAAIALTLCQEQLRDYCPPEHRTAVVAALLGIESGRRKRENEAAVDELGEQRP